MPKILSHGSWVRGPDGQGFQTFAGTDGTDWYDYAHARLVDQATVKILVRDGVVAMVERDGTRIVPPGEVFEAPASVHVERGWLWRGDRVEPPPAEPEIPAHEKLAAFVRANPDVRALLD